MVIAGRSHNGPATAKTPITGDGQILLTSSIEPGLISAVQLVCRDAAAAAEQVF